jgi:large subunit ribosomal protein L17
MAASLLLHEQVRTTVAKAREVESFVNHLLAIAKRKTLVSQRLLAAEIPDHDIRRKVNEVLVPRYQTRTGGCCRFFRLGLRMGDGAEMALLKLMQ